MYLAVKEELVTMLHQTLVMVYYYLYNYFNLVYYRYSIILIYILDINECRFKGQKYPCHGISQICVNNYGGFQCKCIAGYKKQNPTLPPSKKNLCIRELISHFILKLIYKFKKQIFLI